MCDRVRRVGASSAARRHKGLAPTLLVRPAVPVLEADDVVELRRGRLQNDSVLERSPAVDDPGGQAERLPRAHDLYVECATGVADLELNPALVDVDHLVLVAVEL